MENEELARRLAVRMQTETADLAPYRGCRYRHAWTAAPDSPGDNSLKQEGDQADSVRKSVRFPIGIRWRQ